ncbi:MAG: HD domain-containing phosphohydrolase [Spirochaetales bacterium]
MGGSAKKYNLDFEEMIYDGFGTGFAVCEMLYDDNGIPNNFKVLFINKKASEILLVGKEAEGKTIREYVPDIDPMWAKNFYITVKTGKEVNFKGYSTYTNKNLEVTSIKVRDNIFTIEIKDITDKVILSKELENSKERLTLTLESIADGVMASNKSEDITFFNKAAEDITGFKAKDILGLANENVFNIKNKNTNKRIFIKSEDLMNNPIRINAEDGVILRLYNGEWLPIEATAAVIKDKENQSSEGSIIIFNDATKELESKEKIGYLITHDYLTGVYNRYYLEEKFKEYVKTNQFPISIIMGDVNGLKLYNDAFGHEAGDNLLKMIASTLGECIRKEDILARTGGDEFTILLPKTNSQIVAKINNRIETLCLKNSTELMTLSIGTGFATKNTKDDDVNLMKEAEDAMYSAKLQHGKSARSNLIASLENALAEKSPETKTHTNNMLTIINKIMNRLHLSAEQENNLKIAIRLHDIGKVAVDEEILTKTGKVTKEEYEVLKKHSEVGYRILNSVDELKYVAYIVLCHHEHWDGKGYPNNLAEEDIPYLSRIISFIDAYEVMINGRSYKAGKTKQEAIDEIKRCSGTQFDPNLAKLIINILEETPEV